MYSLNLCPVLRQNHMGIFMSRLYNFDIFTMRRLRDCTSDRFLNLSCCSQLNNGQYGQYGAPQSQVLGPQGQPTAPPPQPPPQHSHPHPQHSHPQQHPHPHPQQQQHPQPQQQQHPHPQQQQQPPVFQQFQQEISQRSVNYQHSPIPGNPTPPLTPASSLPPYISPNQDVKPNLVSDLKPSPDMKPPLPVQSELLFFSLSFFEMLIFVVFARRRRTATDVPGSRRHHFAAVPARAQPGGQQPRLPAQAHRAPDAHVAQRSRAAAQVLSPRGPADEHQLASLSPGKSI